MLGAITVPWAGGRLAAATGVGVLPLLSAAGFAAVTLLALVAARLDRTRMGRDARLPSAAPPQT